MPSATSGLAGAAPQTPAETAGTGSGGDDASLESLLAEDDASTQETGGEAADAGQLDANNDLSQDGSSDEQGSDPAEDGQEAGEKDGEEAPKRNKVQERIDKLTARAKEAEEKVSALEAKLKKIEAGESGAESSRGFDPIEDEPSVVKLAGAVSKAEREAKAALTLRRQLRKEPDKVLEILKAKGVELDDADAAYDWLEEYEGNSRDAMGEARAKLVEHKAELKGVVESQKRAWAAAAETRYGWLKDEGDPRNQYIAQAQETYPWIAKLPAGRAALAALADMVHEAKSRAGKAQAQPAQRKPGVRPANGGGGPTSGRVGDLTDKNRQRAQWEARLDQNPDDDEAMAGLLESGLSS